MIKYRAPEDEQDNPLEAEKRRAGGARSAGYTVVRVTWDDLHRWPE